MRYIYTSRHKNWCMAKVLSFLIRYFSNYLTLHRSDLAARAALLDPRLFEYNWRQIDSHVWFFGKWNIFVNDLFVDLFIVSCKVQQPQKKVFSADAVRPQKSFTQISLNFGLWNFWFAFIRLAGHILIKRLNSDQAPGQFSARSF